MNKINNQESEVVSEEANNANEISKQEVNLNLDNKNRGEFRSKITTILQGMIKTNSQIAEDLKFFNKSLENSYNEINKLNSYISQDYENKQEINLVLAFLFSILSEDNVEVSSDKGPYPLSIYFNVHEKTEGVDFICLSVPSMDCRYIMKIDKNSNLSLIKFTLDNNGIRNYNLVNVSEEINENVKEDNIEVKRFKCTFSRESKIETNEDLSEVVFIELNAKSVSKSRLYDMAYYELYKKLYVSNKE